MTWSLTTQVQTIFSRRAETWCEKLRHNLSLGGAMEDPIEIIEIVEDKEKLKKEKEGIHPIDIPMHPGENTEKDIMNGFFS